MARSPRGNDLWICLPDGATRHPDGRLCAVRVAEGHELRTDRFHLPGIGQEAFVSLQHRSVDENNNRGSLVKISGFQVR
jgi:hypothetical protein